MVDLVCGFVWSVWLIGFVEFVWFIEFIEFAAYCPLFAFRSSPFTIRYLPFTNPDPTKMTKPRAVLGQTL